jgi:hypothetical protein
MFLPTRSLGLVALTAIAGTLALAGVASAQAGGRTFQQTYPRASALCAAVAAGGGPARLRSAAGAVSADCTMLEDDFNAARAAVLTARASVRSASVAGRVARAAACTPRMLTRPVCRRARRRELRLTLALRHERTAAVALYYRTIEVNRRLFWSEIHLLPGGARVLADLPIVPQAT